MHPPLRPTRQRQQGVAAIFAALSLVALMSALALGIDVGRLYLAQRDLQRLADLAAIDAARVAGGCLAGVGSRDSAPIEAIASLARNGMPADAKQSTRIGKRITDNQLLAFEAVADNQPWDSVQVELERPSPARILPLFSGDETRTLHARAAAFGGVTLRFDPVPSLGNAGNGVLLGQTLGQQLGGSSTSLALDAAGVRSTSSATVRVGDLIDASESTGVDGSELDQSVPVRGLLSRVAELLSNEGDAASAAVTRAYANAADAGRAVVPRQLLGIPTGTPRALYEDSVVRVDSLLTAVTSTLGQGLDVPGQVKLPAAICNLVASLGIQLCDINVSSRVLTPGTGGLITSGVDTRGSQTSDATVSVGGVLQFQLNIVEPVSKASFTLPVSVRQDAVHGVPGGYSCARRGHAVSEAHLLTSGGAVTVGLGDTSNLSTPPAATIPVTLTTPAVALKINIAATSTTIGGGNGDLCFYGPPFPTTVQCDGGQAIAGRVSGADITAAIAGLRPTATASADPTAPPLDPQTTALLNSVLSSLNTTLPGLLDALSAEALPALRDANLPAGGVPFSLTSFSAKPPTVYAR